MEELGGPLTLVLIQAGSAVQGTLEIADRKIPVSGSATAGGVVALTGSHITQLSRDRVVTMTLTHWTTTVEGAAMSGSFTYTWDLDDLGTPDGTLRLATVTLSGVLVGVRKVG